MSVAENVPQVSLYTELYGQYEALGFALDLFRADEKRKGNPCAIAGLSFYEWGPLPTEIETLLDMYIDLSHETDCLMNRSIREQKLPEPCRGCGKMLDGFGCDAEDVCHDPDGCANEALES